MSPRDAHPQAPWLGAALLALALAGGAAAQTVVKPKMLVIFDTSGSMTWSPRSPGACRFTCPAGEQECVRADTGCAPGIPCGADGRCRPYTYGDGSVSYPGVDVDGNGRPDDSRLYIAKEALATVLAGTAELEFGLMRYAQAEGPFIRSTCACAACGNTCFVSPYDAWPYGAGEGAINYDGTARACRDGGELLVPVGEHQAGAVLSWLDHRESFPYDPQGDRELRADGATPIAGSLRAALQVFANQIIPPDPRRACRDYYVLLLTDGEETCVTDADGRPDQRALEDAARALLDLRVGGQRVPVKTFVVGFGEDTVGSPYLDAIAAAGGTERARFAADRVGLQLALADIIGGAIPREFCNGRDDDCDGEVDEGLLRACDSGCGEGTEICAGGAWQGCTARDPEPERCNLRDDDCDGRVDEGEGGGPLVERCATACGEGERACDNGVPGLCSARAPEPELCNGADEDCDGRVDEAVTRLCQTACGVGRETCQGGAFAGCDAPAAGPEVCNGRDDDCDGGVDEALVRPCQNACGAGQEACFRGAWLGCDAPQVGAEVCNGRDDDCDGRLDEGVVQACETRCEGGVEVCRNGRFADCSARRPAAEVCDAVDDDCDGRVDEGLSRPCATACGVGVERCVDGLYVECSAPAPQAELCNGQDEDCDGAVDENATAACESACGAGLRRCVDGVPGPCNAPAPRDELCNGRDDDCDGRADEGVRRACASICGEGIEICRDGAFVACDARVPRGELCNGADDDCDGRVDETVTRACDNACGLGTEACVDGAFVDCNAPVGREELCNGRDDDCDGRTDEQLRQACETVCGEGLARCVEGRWLCDAPQPAAETCDQTDEDCDGAIDEGVQRTCITRCGRGTEACVDGVFVGCDAPKPAVEACNGADDDCDDFVDEDLTRVCQAACGAGLIQCEDGQLSACSGVTPAPETCDGTDEDCDGQVDEEAPCAGDAVCRFGGCAEPCTNGECPGALRCIDDLCTRDPCLGVACDGGRRCFLGDCVEPACQGQRCPAGEICSRGVCAPRDCRVDGCPEGAVCRAGACVPDPCVGVVCDAQAACRDGACAGTCVGVVCPAGAVCQDGTCRVDPCRDVACGAGEACVDGACAPTCADVVCPVGRLCAAGRCVDDPCLTTRCPAELVCRDGRCDVPLPDAALPPDAAPEDAGVPADAAPFPDAAPPRPAEPPADEGCACDAGAGGSPAAPAALVVLLLLLAPGRRRWLALLALLPLACDSGGGAVVDGGAARCGPDAFELCNGADDDCDGRVDEDFDLVSDPLHCGRCSTRCDFPGGVAACVEGACVLAACEAGFVDADGRRGNGCEATCAAGAGPERCNGLDDDCDGAADEDFDVAVSVAHCGACGRACTLPNADPRCVDGACTLARCQPGFSNEDGRLENGCESPCAPVSPGPEICDREDNDCDGDVDEGFDFLHDGEHCGRCGVRCAYAHGAGTCDEGLCRLTACEAGFVDADGRGENGCEARCTPTGDGVDRCDETDEDCDGRVDEGIDKDTDPENCGGCGRLDDSFVCRFAHAEGACEAGVCLIGRCEAGYVDADGRAANGCETRCVPADDGTERCNGLDDDCDGAVDEGFDLTSLAHCGGCDRVCDGGDAEVACQGGRCVVVACPPGFVDRDQDATNGCEYRCTPTGAEVCDGGDNDCDGGLDEGFDLLADPAHCGGCGRACAPPHGLPVCTLGGCDLVGCEPGWFDADGEVENGCEADCVPAPGGLEACDGVDDDCDGAVDEDFDVRTDPLHCGACGRRCAFPNGVNACVAGACQVVGCQAGWRDLNGDPADGCEYRCSPGGAEVCDGVDQDCDGRVDEAFDLRHDAANCGGCGIDCAAPRAETVCQDGVCAVVACTPGFRDVNGRPGDGCEVACVPAPDGQERCNGVDDDCDGRTDEDWDFQNDRAHCGGCDRACGVPQGDAFCNDGRCAVLRCDPGFADADGRPENGCECTIQNGGRETCDGTDEDCNGVVDDADQLVPPREVVCLSRGVCQGVRPACRPGGWICPYSLDFEADERTCDGLDNDCDGRVDEGFVGLGRPCSVGVGVCGEEGVIACAGPRAVACTAVLHPERQGPEVCNDLDDDCDGRVDEGADALVAIPAGGGVAAFSIYAYEASRPDADAVDPGRHLTRACSKPDALPWTGVDVATAAEACADAGLALCTPAQWQRACAGGAGEPYPYGNVYRPASCNGEDLDTDPAQAGNQDAALPTGSLATCRRTWGGQSVYDLSGNVWEWTTGMADDAHILRGGSFGNLGAGLTCQFELAAPADAARENIGFRCCTP